MADGRVIIETKLDTSGLTQGAKTAKATVENLGKGMETASKQSSSLDTGLKGVTSSLKTLETIAKSSFVMKLASKAMAIIGDIAEETSVVTEKMKAASTLFGDVAVDQENLLNQLYKISTETGESMEVLGQSVYDALSASVEPTEDMANVLKVVSNSAKLAKGGFTDTSTALSATLTVVNAYKKGLDELDSVQSMLLQTQNKGVTTVGELGDALASVTPTAASFGVEFADIATSIALMTKQGTNTKVATTALAQVISELGKSGTTASENLKSAAESAGLTTTSFKGLLEEGYSLGAILELINQYAESNGKSMVDMFSSVEAGRATLQLVGDNAQDFNDILDSMNTSSGLVQMSFEKTVNQSERLSSAWANLKSSIGMKLQPTVATLQSGLAGVIEKMAGQEISADDLSTALQDFKIATKEAEDAQKALGEALNSTTQSQYQQSYATLLTSVQKLSDSYDEAVKKMNDYDEAAKSTNITLSENQRRSRKALEEAQKLNENITFEDLIRQCVECEKGMRDLAEIFPYTAEQERDALAESVLYVAQAEQLATSANDISASWKTAVDDYVDSMAEMVKEGTISIGTLRAINSALADDVEKAMARVVESNETVAVTVNRTRDNIKTAYIDMLTPIITKYQELMSAVGDLNETDLISNEQTASLSEYKSELESLKTSLESMGSSASAALALVEIQLEKVGNALSKNSSIGLKEMESEYDKIMAKSDLLTDKQDALGNTMQSWQDVIEELNDLYVELAEQYGTTSEACTELAGRIEKLSKLHNDELAPLEELEEEYQKIIDSYKNTLNVKDALGKSISTEEDKINDLNELYTELVKKYGEGSEACQELKKRIDELNESTTSKSDLLTPYVEMEKEYDAIIKKSENLSSGMDALGNSIRTEADTVDELNELYIKLAEQYGETSYACIVLKGRIEDISRAMESEGDAVDENKQALEEMETAYSSIITKSEMLTGKQDALGNEMYSNEDVVDDLNSLYRTLAEKYGIAAEACVTLKKRIDELNGTQTGEKTALEEISQAYQKIIDKSSALTGKQDALGNVMRTEQDDIQELNNLYVEMVEKYGESADSVVWLKGKIDELNSGATDGVDDWKEFGEQLKSTFENAGQSLAQGVGSAIEELAYQLLSIPEQVAEIESQIDAVASKEEDQIKALEAAESELNDAKARGNQADIDAAEKKIAEIKKEQAALAEEKKTLEKNKKEVESGAEAWKSMSKVALLALADVLESLGAQLAAQAVVQAVGTNWVMAGIATAGSIAAYVAAGLIKASANKYEHGGIVGGNSPHGDQILARVNSGELILNAAQQENLARVIEAAAVLAQATGGGNGITINFEGVNFYGLDEPAVGKAIYENIRTLQYEGVI